MKTENNAVVLKAARIILDLAEDLKRSSSLDLNGVSEWDSPETAMEYRDLLRTAQKLRGLTLREQSDL